MGCHTDTGGGREMAEKGKRKMGEKGKKKGKGEKGGKKGETNSAAFLVKKSRKKNISRGGEGRA